MLALPPRSPDVRYYEFYRGIVGFDCAALRSTLTPASCAANWIANREGSACVGCQTGQIHAGKANQPPSRYCNVAHPCIRCGERALRLVCGRTLCLSCYNRQVECLTGLNRKHAYPCRVADTLHPCHAILTGSNLMETFYQNKSIRRDALPRLTQINPGSYWLECIVTDARELNALLDRRLPGAVLDDFEVRESFGASRDATIR